MGLRIVSMDLGLVSNQFFGIIALLVDHFALTVERYTMGREVRFVGTSPGAKEIAEEVLLPVKETRRSPSVEWPPELQSWEFSGTVTIFVASLSIVRNNSTIRRRALWLKPRANLFAWSVRGMVSVRTHERADIDRCGILRRRKLSVHSKSAGYRRDVASSLRKVVMMSIIEEDSYEKDALFYVELGEPQLQGAEAGVAVAAEMKQPDERTAEEKMALLGKPKLGEVFRAQVRIKESKEFKNTVDKLVQRANASILLGLLGFERNASLPFPFVLSSITATQRMSYKQTPTTSTSFYDRVINLRNTDLVADVGVSRRDNPYVSSNRSLLAEDGDEDQRGSLPIEMLPGWARREVYPLGLNGVQLFQTFNWVSAVMGQSTSSWKEQFTEALTVSGGDEDDGDGGEPAAPSTLDYLMHGVTIFWKVLFAFVPPTGKSSRYRTALKRTLSLLARQGTGQRVDSSASGTQFSSEAMVYRFSGRGYWKWGERHGCSSFIGLREIPDGIGIGLDHYMQLTVHSAPVTMNS
ncbi:Sodium/calcium exchanger 2 [Eufriesea mexicana]|nr:Sodium/calcium exchanger 2 [Eufriesea mexicana]